MVTGQRPCRDHPAARLLVCEDEDDGVLELLLLKDGVELELAGAYPVHVAAVHDIDDRLRVGVVAPPVWADARLPAEVPYLELDVLVRHRLDVEPDRRDRGDNLAHLRGPLGDGTQGGGGKGSGGWAGSAARLREGSVGKWGRVL